MDIHKWSVHICIISLHVMYQLISVAYILNMYIYIYTYQHQSFEYTVCKVILPLAHGHPQCILRATSLNDPRSTEQAYRQKECGQGAFPKRDAKKPCQDWPKRVNTGKTMQWYWHVGWQNRISDWVSTWIVFGCITKRSHFRRTLTLFRLPLEKTPLLVKYMSNWRELAEPFPLLQLAVVPFLLMIMIFLIGVVACCGNLLIHTGSNHP